VKYLVFFGLFLSIFLLTLPADAAMCSHFQGQQICVVNIQRSAKKHWEYRVIASIDGVTQPLETYNCRSRYRVTKGKVIVSFQPGDIGSLICKNLK
jgi:hypothetical protein